ncbi:hypothetical protein JZ785_20610 [Alicyclobacillus curvatus]|nr:hypothetical protein JZ785_20610 [Alicyclobacillus curvatus]
MTKKMSKLSLTGAAVAFTVLSGAPAVGLSPIARAATSTTSTNAGAALAPINVSSVHSFAVSASAVADVSQSVPIIVTAEDSNSALVTNYTGTVHFTSSDEWAALPKDYTFQPSDKGVHTFWVTFNTTGPQTISLTSTSASNQGTGSSTGAKAAGSDITGNVSIRVQPVSSVLTHRIEMNVNGSPWTNPMAFTSGNSLRVPIYYVQHVLDRLGFQSVWDGLHLSVITPTWLPTQSSSSVMGQGTASISLNGTVTTQFTKLVESKWESPRPTTYADFSNVFQTLALLGIGSSFGQNDDAWNWQLPLSIQGQSTMIAGETDSLSLNWTTGKTVAAVPSGLVSWNVSGSGDATIDTSGVFHATVPGTYTVTGTYAGVPTQMNITVQPRVAKLQVSAASSWLTANGAATDAITVTATDDSGKPAVGSVLKLTLSPGNVASLDTETGVTNSQGQAVFTLTAGGAGGTVTISAAGGGATASTDVYLRRPRPASVPSSVKFMNPPGIPSTGSYPQNGNGPIAFPVEFQVLDQFGNPMSGVTVDFFAPMPLLQGTMDVSSAVTNSQGIATVNYTWSWMDHGYITATIHGTNISATSSLITNGPG